MAAQLSTKQTAELSSDIHVITAEINAYQRVAGEAIFEIGRRLKHVKENDLAHGEWAKWLESINLTQGHARRFIRVYERFGKHTPVHELPSSISVLYELTSFSDEELAEPHTMPDGSTKILPEMSRREIEELKRQLRLEQQARERERAGHERLEYELRKAHDEKASIERELRALEMETEGLAETKRQIERLTRERDDISRQIESATELSALAVEIEDFLKTKLAPIKYSRALTERRDSDVVDRNLLEIIENVESWAREMRGYLKGQASIKVIDAEAIVYDA